MLLMPPLIQNHHFFTIKVEMYLACFFYILRMRHLRTFFLNKNATKTIVYNISSRRFANAKL